MTSLILLTRKAGQLLSTSQASHGLGHLVEGRADGRVVGPGSWDISLSCPHCGSSFWELPLTFLPCQGIPAEGDTDPGGGLDLEEFILYLQEREQRLLLLFHSLDRNQDGKAGGWGCGGPGDPSGARTGNARRKRGGPLLPDDSQAISGALLTLS